LDKVKKYIDDTNKRPSKHDKDHELRILGLWIGSQQQNYKSIKNIMKDKDIYDLWTDFISDERYKKYFASRNSNNMYG
jgi:hypothetical protein